MLKFACGRFLTTAKIPDDKSRLSLFDPLQEEISSRGRTLLEEPANPDQDFESYDKARVHYKACMNLQKLEDLGVKPLQVRLKRPV